MKKNCAAFPWLIDSTCFGRLPRNSTEPRDRENVEAGLRAVDPNRVASLLLGREIVRSDVSSEEISERLVRSLNTVFDSLNRIVATIHAKLLGEERQEETIRQFIDSEIKGETGNKSLQGYLDQIQQAFLIAHQAFQTASETVIRQFLSELDPEKMMEAAEGRLKFGPLRKAELFELYREQYRRCNGFFESGRVTERLLREFEKTCQRLYQE